MTNSDTDTALQALAEIDRACAQDTLKTLIDLPIESVVDRLLLRPTPHPETTSEFNRAVAQFFQELGKEALLPRLSLTPQEAFALAVDLLDSCYGRPGTGYEDSLVDVVEHGSESIDSIFQALAEALKARERAKYVRWIEQVHVESLPWPARCALVVLITKACSSDEDVAPLTVQPARFAGELDALVAAYLASVQATEQFRMPQYSGVSP